MSDLRALIEAAKADAPSTAARANVWAGVSNVVGEAASAASAVGGAATGSSWVRPRCWSSERCSADRSRSESAGRCCSWGTRRSSGRRWRRRAGPGRGDAAGRPRRCRRWRLPRGIEPRSRGERVRTAAASPDASWRTRLEAGRRTRARALGARGPGDAVAAKGRLAAAESDTLAREASALAEARGALARHDALSALQIVRSLRALPGRQLVPEELAVEAQALRGLGLDEDANAVETRLRVRFPDSVLGR